MVGRHRSSVERSSRSDVWALVLGLGALSCTAELGPLGPLDPAPSAPPSAGAGSSAAGAPAPIPTSTAGGSGGSGAGSGGSSGVPPACVTKTTSRVRRLSSTEYRRAIRDLVGAEPATLFSSAPEAVVHGFDNNADALTISSGNLEDFALTAELTAASIDPLALAACEPAQEPEACARSFAQSFAARAYGRPATPEEAERLVSQYRLGAGLEDHARGIRLVVETVLLSPHFLYRVELGSSAEGGTAELTLDPFETANALAFALTGARPDAALSARAREDSAFSSPRVLREEAARLLATAASREHLSLIHI